MIYVFCGPEKESYKEILKIKSKYKKSTVITDYSDLPSVFNTVCGYSLFDSSSGLFILYNLDTKHIWIKDLIEEVKNRNVILSFSNVNKNTNLWKFIKGNKGCKVKEIKEEYSSIFNYVDQLANGETRSIFKNLPDFYDTCESIEALLALLFRHFYIILNIKAMLSKGYSDDIICGKVKLSSYVYFKYKKSAQYYSMDNIIKCLNFIAWMRLQVLRKYSGDNPSFSDEYLMFSVLSWFNCMALGKEIVYKGKVV